MAKMMRLQWTQDLDIETLDARGHWATMEELLEVVTSLSFVSLRKHREDVQGRSGSSQPLRLNIRHEICGGVFVHQGEGVSPYELSALDRRHG